MKKCLIIGFAVIACISLVLVPFAANNSFEASFVKTLDILDRIGEPAKHVLDIFLPSSKPTSAYYVTLNEKNGLNGFFFFEYFEEDDKYIITDWKCRISDSNSIEYSKAELENLFNSLSYVEVIDKWYIFLPEVNFYDINGNLLLKEDDLCMAEDSMMTWFRNEVASREIYFVK